MIRAGIGYDVHPLKRGRRLILGGVEIAFDKGLDGHSDADVLIHSIIDAILGAMAEKDIGFYFPVSDPAWRDASSVEMLEKVRMIVHEKGFTIINLDSIIIADQPPLAAYFEAMKDRIASTLRVSREMISIKGKRVEGLGFVGKGEGMAAQAVALLQRER
ncbi:MAG: 2-C-methyl-D-erythritol 2,4-cyclodiphosphate synthase [Acidobacteriota bacterium]